MDDELRRLLIKLIRNDDERHIAEFLDKIGLKFVAANSTFYDDDHRATNEIDLIFTFQKKILVIEVSTDASKVNRQRKRKKLREWEAKKNQVRLAEKHELDKRDTMYAIYIDLSKNEAISDGAIQNDPNVKTIIIRKSELIPTENQKGIKSAKAFLDLVIEKAKKIGRGGSN